MHTFKGAGAIDNGLTDIKLYFGGGCPHFQLELNTLWLLHVSTDGYLKN